MRRTIRAVLAAVLLAPVVTVAVPSVSAARQATHEDGSFDDSVATRPGTSSGASATESLDGPRSTHSASAPTVEGAALASHPSVAERGAISQTMPSQPLLAAGFSGQGVKVGIIDYFDSSVLATQISQGELPSIPDGHRKCFQNTTTCPFGSPGDHHGNAIAEVVAEAAPNAELYLAEVGGLSGYYAAIDWFAANGVKVLNHSLIGVFDGPGDGTGPRAAIVDYAVAKGIAWFNSAGDSAPEFPGKYEGGHWRGAWSDPTGNRWLNFSGTDETLGTYCGALLGLRWSDWGAGRTDYELWVGDLNIQSGYNSTPVLASDYNQTTGSVPIEANDFRWLCNTDASQGPVYDKNRDGFVSLKVKRSTRSTAASAVNDVLEIQVINGWFEYNTAYGSASIPFADSKNLGAASVGFGGQWSAQGPTNDGRVKPDFSAPGCVATSVYGDCVGNDAYRATDISSAVAAGTAAAVLSAYGAMEPWQLVQYLRNTAPPSRPEFAIWPMPALPNNQVGHGDIRTLAPATRSTVSGKFFAVSERVLDTRVASMDRNSTAPLPPNGVINLRIRDLGGLDRGPLGTTMVLNITVVNATGPGYVQVVPTGQAVPGSSSTLNVERAGQTIANVTVVTLNPNREISLYVRGGGHVLVDRIGDFGGRMSFVPIEPYRAYDSRCATCGHLPGGTWRDIPIVGTGPGGDADAGVPADASIGAVMISVTTDAPAAKGFLSALQYGVLPPITTSTSNYQAGRNTTGFAIVPAHEGKIRIYSSADVHFQVDVLGVFGGELPGGGFVPMTPTRAVDTRLPTGSPRPAAGAATTVDVGLLGVPADASAILGNLTTTGAAGPGELRIGANATTTSRTYRNVSIPAAGAVTSAAVASQLDHGTGTVIATASAHRILDVFGWFEPVARVRPGSIVAAPFDAAHAPRAGGMPVASPNGQFVAFGIWTDTGGYTVQWWDRSTGSVEAMDAGHTPITWNQPVGVRRVSNDGRLVLESYSSDLFPGDTDVDADMFTYDRATGELAHLEFPAVLVQMQGNPWFNDDLTEAAFVTTAQVIGDDTDAGRDSYALDLATGEASLLSTGPNFPDGTYIANFSDNLASGTTSAAGFWQRDGEVLALPSGDFHFLSPDGRYALGTTTAAPVRTYLVDGATGQETTLCTRTAEGGRSVGLAVDWTSGPPVVGDWCNVRQYSDFLVLQSDGLVTVLSTPTGLPLRTSTYYTVTAVITPIPGDAALFTTSAVNVLPGTRPFGWVYVWSDEAP